MENVITLIGLLLLFCPPPLCFVFENSKNTRNELVMGIMFLYGERAKRARHSQVCSIENRDMSTYVCMSHLPFDP